MLLQVHDELILEAPEAEAAHTIAVVKNVMTSAPGPALVLKAPLVVEATAAANWSAAH
jgi:DNA polymerase-1